MHGITAQGKPLKDHFEITGHNEAINWVIDVVKGDYPLTESFIRELHKLLLKESYEVDAQTPDGKPTKKRVAVGSYKTSPNHVQTKTSEMFYFATPEGTPAKMGNLMEWYNERIADLDFNPILLAAEFHYKFILIHPFDDGNGRTARILMNFILMKFGYPPVIIKTDDKENYYAVLHLADTGNLEAFVEYIAKNLNRSLEIMIAGAQGEDIEESDDIDKEIALLEKKLSSLGDKSSMFKSVEALNILLEDVVLKIYQRIIDRSGKLSTMYMNTSLHFQSIIPDDIFGHSYDFEEITKRIEVLLECKRLIIGIRFENFTTVGFDGFNYTTGFGVDLHSTYYSIFNKANNPSDSVQKPYVIQKPYGINLTESEIDKIAIVEVKRHTAFIEQKIAEKEKGQ